MREKPLSARAGQGEVSKEPPAWDWDAISRRCETEARRILRNPLDAEDVVQEAMMRAWSRRRSCNSPQAPLPWCLQITRHEAFRRLARSRPCVGEHALPELADGTSSEEADRAIDRIDVRRALARLAPDEQVLLALRYSHDYSQPEIARTLNIPEGTAKVRLHRARSRLGMLIKEASCSPTPTSQIPA